MSENDGSATRDTDGRADAQQAILSAAAADPSLSNAELAEKTGTRIALVRDIREAHDATAKVGNTADTADRDSSAGAQGQVEAGVHEEVVRLRERNRRLRVEHEAARKRGYRRSAVAMAVLGILALGGAAVFPVQATVLLALGGTGLFAAVLTYFLTPERFVAASVGERIHRAHDRTLAELIDELGLGNKRWYIPTPERSEHARLFIPQGADAELPATVDGVFVVAAEAEQRGLAVIPTGDGLYDSFVETVTGDPAAEPVAAARQLADAIVEVFELADAAGVDADRGGGRIVVRISGPVYGELAGPDHPVVSTLAVGVAAASGKPVRAEVTDDERADGLVILEY